MRVWSFRVSEVSKFQVSTQSADCLAIIIATAHQNFSDALIMKISGVLTDFIDEFMHVLDSIATN
jgi:hypothetical protein